VTALFATDRLALVDADLNAALRTEIVHRGGRGGLLVARLVGAGRGGVLAGHFGGKGQVGWETVAWVVKVKVKVVVAVAVREARERTLKV
jgi:hypothetical protein